MDDPRLADHWKKIHSQELPRNLPKGAVAILSYPDDEGIRLNNGRPGADLGPERILHYLGRFVYFAKRTPEIYVLYNRFAPGSLELRHQEAETLLIHLLKLKLRVITLGGGHDYGYPDASAYFQVHKGKILNLDAHLDLRPVVEGRLTSGTPFFRFAERFGGRPLYEWGLHSQTNSLSHLDYAKKNQIKLFWWNSKMPKISGKVGLSVCLDAFSGIRAVSAPALYGLKPEAGIECVDFYAKRSHWLGLYEAAPRLDPINEDACRLAAVLAYRFIHAGKLPDL